MDTDNYLEEFGQSILTADGVEVGVGGAAYDYYADALDDSAVVVFKQIDRVYPSGSVWGIWTHADGTGMVLRDRSRVSSLDNAVRRGWLSAETRGLYR